MCKCMQHNYWGVIKVVSTFVHVSTAGTLPERTLFGLQLEKRKCLLFGRALVLIVSLILALKDIGSFLVKIESKPTKSTPTKRCGCSLKCNHLEIGSLLFATCVVPFRLMERRNH